MTRADRMPTSSDRATTPGAGRPVGGGADPRQNAADRAAEADAWRRLDPELRWVADEIGADGAGKDEA